MRYGVGDIAGVRKYVRDMEFPAEKDDILTYLRLNGASAEILATADRLADQTFEDAEEVISDLASWLGK